MMSLILAVVMRLPLLTSYSADVVMMGTKPFIEFSLEYSEPLDVEHRATFDVTYSTPTGPQTLGYMVIIPQGTTGVFTDLNPFLKTWTVISWQLSSEAPYYE